VAAELIIRAMTGALKRLGRMGDVSLPSLVLAGELLV
jgi:hypothetical protein